MLETRELEREIKKQINNIIPNLELSKIKFEVGKENSPEGIYVYSQDDKYYFVFAEKGKIRERKELYTEKDVLWNVLDNVLFNIAMDYAIENRVYGKDFRRTLFAKEIELFAMFGSEFAKMKKDEINKILEENPYNDK